MRLSKTDRRFLAWEGFLSLVLLFLSIAGIVLCKFALGSELLTYVSIALTGYFLGSSVVYLRIAHLK